MPLLKLQTSVQVPEPKREALLSSLSKTVARVMGKPEGYMMATLDCGAICMGGKTQPAAFADVRGIGGFNPKVNAQLSKEVGDILRKELSIDPKCIYMTFTDVAAQNWGWNGGTFG